MDHESAKHRMAIGKEPVAGIPSLPTAYLHILHCGLGLASPPDGRVLICLVQRQNRSILVGSRSVSSRRFCGISLVFDELNSAACALKRCSLETRIFWLHESITGHDHSSGPTYIQKI